MVAMRVPDAFRSPRVRISFEDKQPWCRFERDGRRDSIWVRVGVENVGIEPARGCVGRLLGLNTDGKVREDIDPVQLRWAGVPRSLSFTPVDIRRNQREFLNVLFLREARFWRIVTFEDADFDPGFGIDLEPDAEHILHIAVFSDNAETRVVSLLAVLRTSDGSGSIRLVEDSGRST
jgi:hypothetical protein